MNPRVHASLLFTPLLPSNPTVYTTNFLIENVLSYLSAEMKSIHVDLYIEGICTCVNLHVGSVPMERNVDVVMVSWIENCVGRYSAARTLCLLLSSSRFFLNECIFSRVTTVY